MAEDKNYTNNKERPREDEELEIDLMEYVRKLWAARKVLLKAAGIGVAMGNASEKVQSVADFVTDTVDNNGLCKALKQFGVI